MKKQFSHGTPQQMLDIVNNKITELESQSVDSSTKISGATGSVDDMIDAVNSRINELSSNQNSVNSAEHVPSDKEELILPEDYETIYLDSQYTFGDGGELSLAQIKEYWNGNYDGDPSLAMYDSFDSWWRDTERWLSRVYNSTDVDSVESASYFFDDEDNTDGSNYIHTLIGYLKDELNNKVENLSVEEGEEELNIVITVGETVLEFTVPLADLTCKFETINEDVKYIVDAIEKDISENENIQSSIAIKASKDSGRFIMLAHKSVPDMDGFNTDYTLYHDTEEDMYVCVFGDNDVYTPENSDYDWEGESIDEAYEWFDSYEGFADRDDDIYSAEDVATDDDDVIEWFNDASASVMDAYWTSDGKIIVSLDHNVRDIETTAAELISCIEPNGYHVSDWNVNGHNVFMFEVISSDEYAELASDYSYISEDDDIYSATALYQNPYDEEAEMDEEVDEDII